MKRNTVSAIYLPDRWVFWKTMAWLVSTEIMFFCCLDPRAVEDLTLRHGHGWQVAAVVLAITLAGALGDMFIRTRTNFFLLPALGGFAAGLIFVLGLNTGLVFPPQEVEVEFHGITFTTDTAGARELERIERDGLFSQNELEAMPRSEEDVEKLLAEKQSQIQEIVNRILPLEPSWPSAEHQRRVFRGTFFTGLGLFIVAFAAHWFARDGDRMLDAWRKKQGQQTDAC